MTYFKYLCAIECFRYVVLYERERERERERGGREGVNYMII